MIARWKRDDARAFDDAWHGRTTAEGEIADLVAQAESWCRSAVAEPSQQFRTALRVDLMTEARTVLVPTPPSARPRAHALPRRTHPLRRRLAAVTAAVVTAVGGVGLVASSASAVPGDMLYPVKRGVESVELALHRGDASRGAFELDRASERLDEAKALTDQNSAQSDGRVAGTLDDFSTQAQAGSRALFSDFASNRSQRSVEQVNDFAVAAANDLRALSATVPVGAGGSFSDAADIVRDLSTQVAALCSTCAPADVGPLVDAVSDLARRTPLEQAGPDKDKATAGPDDGSTPAPSQRPVIAAPKAPSAQPETLRESTDPVLGLLLGDDDQQGVVPGLLGGIIGSSP